MQPAIIYLHGFVSGPEGAKAQHLSDWLAGHGIPLRRPDLNVPDFERMTVSTMVERVAAEVADAPAPVTLIGSSLGGFTALHFLRAHAGGLAGRVARLVLLAPALDFPTRFLTHAGQTLGPEAVTAWRAAGSLPLFHHAHGREMPLGWWFAEDLPRWPVITGFDPALPTLVIHGMQDESVPYDLSVRAAEGRPHVQRHLLGGADHGMLDWLDVVCAQIGAFLRL